MGKRKKAAKKPQGPKKQEPLPTSFPCLFCNHEKSVSVKMDKKAATGELTCKICGQQFQTVINYLSAAVDVYSDWIDACDAVAKEAAGTGVEDEPRSLNELAPGGRRNSDMQIDKHLVGVIEDDGLDDDDEY